MLIIKTIQDKRIMCSPKNLAEVMKREYNLVLTWKEFAYWCNILERKQIVKKSDNHGLVTIKYVELAKLFKKGQMLTAQGIRMLKKCDALSGFVLYKEGEHWTIGELPKVTLLKPFG